MGVGLELFEAFWLNDTTKLANFWVFLFAPLFGAYMASIFYNSIYLPLLKKWDIYKFNYGVIYWSRTYHLTILQVTSIDITSTLLTQKRVRDHQASNFYYE